MIKLRHVLFFGLMLLLGGCKLAILDPKGVIAASEKHLLIEATLLMLVVVIPVIILSFVFAWKYRARSTQAKYSPNWSHSTTLEAVCWAIPCVIIAILAVVTWISSHKLDPYRPLGVKNKPIIIQAIALDWKWLFIYPKQHIASVNFVQIPVNVPVRFLVTADAPMNSLEIPRLAGQIYAMTGMRSKLNIMATEAGYYNGFSTNFSGDGFSGMTFIVRAGSQKQFDRWVKKTQHSPTKLTVSAYKKLARPSENNPVEYFSSVANHLFKKVIMKYTQPHMQEMGEKNAKLNAEKRVGNRHA